jgi:hypothetical protein
MRRVDGLVDDLGESVRFERSVAPSGIQSRGHVCRRHPATAGVEDLAVMPIYVQVLGLQDLYLGICKGRLAMAVSWESIVLMGSDAVSPDLGQVRWAGLAGVPGAEQERQKRNSDLAELAMVSAGTNWWTTQPSMTQPEPTASREGQW